jgi:glycosyltransferase involved in cell wall biosynthesis
MIIGIDASRANRSLRTGTEWYSFYIILNLAAIDRNNQYILYLDKAPANDLAAALKAYPNFRLQILRWPWPYFWTLGRLSWEMLMHAPDVLFVPAHSLPLIHPRRTVNTIHDIAFARESDLYQKKGVRLETEWLKRFFNFIIRLFTCGRFNSNSLDYLIWSTAYALRHAFRIIAVSSFTKQEIIDIYTDKYADKIRMVHNGYPRDLYQPWSDNPQRRKILEKYSLDEPFFLYVGRLEKKKNTAALVEAFAIFKEVNPSSDVKLVMIGNAGFGYDEVKYIIEEYDLGRSVMMPGWVVEEDLPAIFSSARAFVFPTLHEGFGIPALQAMACGVPALLSDLPVLREIAGEAALYFNPRDKQAIASAMTRIYKDESLSKSLSAQGLQQVSHFSWEQSARETLSILEEK